MGISANPFQKANESKPKTDDKDTKEAEGKESKTKNSKPEFDKEFSRNLRGAFM